MVISVNLTETTTKKKAYSYSKDCEAFPSFLSRVNKHCIFIMLNAKYHWYLAFSMLNL